MLRLGNRYHGPGGRDLVVALESGRDAFLE